MKPDPPMPDMARTPKIEQMPYKYAYYYAFILVDLKQIKFQVASKRHCTMPLWFFVCDGCGTSFARTYKFGPAGKRDKWGRYDYYRNVRAHRKVNVPIRLMNEIYCGMPGRGSYSAVDYNCSHWAGDFLLQSSNQLVHWMNFFNFCINRFVILALCRAPLALGMTAPGLCRK
uniref:LRAT domain-containing protein n=1 Tax=Globodera pallida TaxID=36090 RepID=A0A183BL49_GLOPA